MNKQPSKKPPPKKEWLASLKRWLASLFQFKLSNWDTMVYHHILGSVIFGIGILFSMIAFQVILHLSGRFLLFFLGLDVHQSIEPIMAVLNRADTAIVYIVCLASIVTMSAHALRESTLVLIHVFRDIIAKWKNDSCPLKKEECPLRGK